MERQPESNRLSEHQFWSDIAEKLQERGFLSRVSEQREGLPEYMGCGIMASCDDRKVAIGRFRHFILDEVLQKDLLSLDSSFYNGLIEKVTAPEVIQALAGIDAVLLDFRPSMTQPHNKTYRFWDEKSVETILVLDMNYLLDIPTQNIRQGIHDMKKGVEENYRISLSGTKDARDKCGIIPDYKNQSHQVYFTSSRTPSVATLRDIMLESMMVRRFEYNADPDILQKERRFLEFQNEFIELTKPQKLRKATFAVAQAIFGNHGLELEQFFKDFDMQVMSQAPDGFCMETYLNEHIIGKDIFTHFGIEETSENQFYEQRGLNDLALLKYGSGEPANTFVRLATTNIPKPLLEQILQNAQEAYQILVDAHLFQTVRGIPDQYLEFRQALEHILGCIDPAKLPNGKIEYGTLNIRKDEIVIWTPSPEKTREARTKSYYSWGVFPGGELDYRMVKFQERDPGNDYAPYYGISSDEYTYLTDQDVPFITLPKDDDKDFGRAEPHIRASILRQAIPDGTTIVMLHTLEETGYGYVPALIPIASRTT